MNSRHVHRNFKYETRAHYSQMLSLSSSRFFCIVRYHMREYNQKVFKTEVVPTFVGILVSEKVGVIGSPRMVDRYDLFSCAVLMLETLIAAPSWPHTR